ncbi:OPA3-domain-containing protein [Wallemia mellicola]|uniref:OPA3-domain-containing protein n=1 Tax=Wallemia mellicola TaxID=1708541 RepID=A0AB38MWG6_9BASI|nr:OPA3-domain-containing protein [Wallemia mellicola]TIC64368.1 OPA3-domain-containing protein [Wallemia mellicola]
MSLSTKLGSLFIRTLAKPISSSLKNQASNHESFKRVCVNVAQGLHSFEGRMRSNLLGQKQHNTRPLSEARAIQQGANTMSEAFLFTVAAALILGETWRSSKKESTRREDVKDKLEMLDNSVKTLCLQNDELIHENDNLRAAFNKLINKETFKEAQKELELHLAAYYYRHNMGNTTSSSSTTRERGIDHVDGGTDWDKDVVRELIIQRKLAPFYKGLNDYNNEMSDLDILQEKYNGNFNSPNASPQTQIKSPRRTASNSSNQLKKPTVNFEAFIYRNAQECPICFLFYPPNQNRSRCCDQPLCTDCFVQIKRAEPTTTHLESEPAACPYCAQDNFGITYSPPQWRAGTGASPSQEINIDKALSNVEAPRQRRKSISADSPEVVTIDTIRPDWKLKLDHVRAQAARRANRRIIMRQVGDRLVPIGVTSSRHPLANSQLPTGLFLSSEGTVQSTQQASQQPAHRSRSNRAGRRAVDNLVNSLGTGADLEDAMIMEAMRLSLLDEQERNRRRDEEERDERQALERSSSQIEMSTDNQSVNTPEDAQPKPTTNTIQADEQSNVKNDNSEHSSLANEYREQRRLSDGSIDRTGLLAPTEGSTSHEQ